MIITDVMYFSKGKILVSVSSDGIEVVNQSETVRVNDGEYDVSTRSSKCGCENPKDFNLILFCKNNPKKVIMPGDTLVKVTP